MTALGWPKLLLWHLNLWVSAPTRRTATRQQRYKRPRIRPQLWSGRYGLPAACAVLSILLAGCISPIGVNRISLQEANRSLNADVLTTGKVGTEANQFLSRLNLVERYQEDPVGTIAAIHSGLGQADDSSRLFVLAELSFAYAQRTSNRSYFVATAAYAWQFLFPQNAELHVGPYDPRVRTAMDLYDRGVTEGLASGMGVEVDLSARTIALPYGALQVSVDPSGFKFGGYKLEQFVSLADFEVRGLRNRYRRRGIGAPLAASVAKSGEQSVDRWLAPRTKVPVTALLRFSDPVLGTRGTEMHATIELYDDAETAAVQIDGRSVPLESEITAALAYQLEGAPVWDFEFAGFRKGDFGLASEKDNLFMLHPHRPGRIPVIFVHGTASSPARWAEMANELMNDPVLAQRYELWFYIYNTGNPVAYSAMGLRESLQRAAQDLDPQGQDPAMRQMVVIGHSQGGLLTKMTVVSSGTRFWDAGQKVPLDQIKMSAGVKDLVRRTMFVEPLPSVTTVVFICTPHRGSFVAEGFFGKIGRRLVSLPGTLTKASVDVVQLNPGAAAQQFTLPTAIDNMDGSNPFIQTLSALPIAPGVDAHSIIAVKGDGPPDKGDDGVVKYSSAHIDGVASELIVRSGHSAQAVPETIEEVRRILYEHLEHQ
jgi:pimeloyl-ACP methyl ester carboxylesterase